MATRRVKAKVAQRASSLKRTPPRVRFKNARAANKPAQRLKRARTAASPRSIAKPSRRGTLRRY